MNGLVRELSRELAGAAIEYFISEERKRLAGGVPVLDEVQLAEVLYQRAATWLDGKDVQGLMLKVLAGKLG